jgi:hypothetical protein
LRRFPVAKESNRKSALGLETRPKNLEIAAALCERAKPRTCGLN